MATDTSETSTATAKDSDTILVRLKPYNERKGHVTKIYMFDGYRFIAEKGWYEVPTELGERLRDLTQDHYNDESPALFDVATEAQAQKLDEREAKALADARSSARQPQKVTGGRQRTQALPINNAGGLAGLPGDFTTEDLYKGIHGTQPTGGPGPASDEASDHNDADAAEGLAQGVGRVRGQKKRR